MSATLTWYSSGYGTKTGTSLANMLDDLDTLVTSKAGDSNFKWEIAGKNSATTPYYLLLSRKDGSAGRIAWIQWTTAPGTPHPTLLDGAPSTSYTYLTYFPNGTGTTLSNLAAASGTICGNDTGALKVVPIGQQGTLYTTNYKHFYFDCAEGVFFGIEAASSQYNAFAGDLVVDALDAAYPAVCGIPQASIFGSSSSPVQFNGSALQAGPAATTPHMRVNYGTNNKLYFFAYAPSGWANMAVGAYDPLTDAANSRAFIVPCPLVGHTKSEGLVLKLRQIGFGPGTVSAFASYNTTGPVVAARCFCPTPAGADGRPWMTNFKL